MAKGAPILVDQDQDGVRNLAGEGLIAIQVLDPVEDFCIRYPDPGVDVGLAKVVGGLIVEVLRGEGRSVDSRRAGIALLDTMLLDELHVWPPSSYSLSCYSLAHPKKRSPARVSCSSLSQFSLTEPAQFREGNMQSCSHLGMNVIISYERFQHLFPRFSSRAPIKL
jgi:hypothetical protein